MQSMKEKLEYAGLTGNESKVYLELLKHAELNGNEVAKKTGLDRSLCYTVLNNLIEKALVSYVIKEKKRVFSASDPENLLKPIKQKEEVITSLIPELKAVEKIVPGDHKVTIYESKEGLKVLLNSIEKSKTATFFGGTGKSYDILKWEMKLIEKKVVKLGIIVRGIMNSKYKSHQMMEQDFVDIRFLDNVESDVTTTIGDDFIGIHVLKEKPFIIIIHSKDVAKGYKAYFEFMWRAAEIQEFSK